MGDEERPEILTGRTFVQPHVEPSSRVFYRQQSCLLTEMDYTHLTSSVGPSNAIGGSLLGFGVGYALPKAVSLIEAMTAGEKFVISSADLWVTGITVLGGIGLLILGKYVFSGKKNAVKRRIETHFKDNPARHEIVSGD